MRFPHVTRAPSPALRELPHGGSLLGFVPFILRFVGVDVPGDPFGCNVILFYKSVILRYSNTHIDFNFL